jgi:hypothetical protein
MATSTQQECDDMFDGDISLNESNISYNAEASLNSHELTDLGESEKEEDGLSDNDYQDSGCLDEYNDGSEEACDGIGGFSDSDALLLAYLHPTQNPSGILFRSCR